MILPGAMWAVVTLLLLAADPDTHRGVCEEGGLPRGGANEQVLRLQLAASSRTSEKKEEEGVAGGKLVCDKQSQTAFPPPVCHWLCLVVVTSWVP